MVNSWTHSCSVKARLYHCNKAQQFGGLASSMEAAPRSRHSRHRCSWPVLFLLPLGPPNCLENLFHLCYIVISLGMEQGMRDFGILFT